MFDHEVLKLDETGISFAFLLDKPEHFKNGKHKDFSSFFKRCENALLRITAVTCMDSVWTLLYL